MKIELLDGEMPKKAHESDVGYDIFSAEDRVLGVGRCEIVRAGFKMQLDDGIEAQIRSRSGMALNSQVIVLNSPGTVDTGYRGEIKVIMANMGSKPHIIKKGDRIAQMVFAKYESPKLIKGTIEESDRGENGFGSTGS